MKFCEKLQMLRKEKGYSQEDLADLLDVSRQSVSKWESGTTYPEMDKLIALAKIFNTTLDELTNDTATINKNKESKNNFSNLVYSLLDMINKSIEMFKNQSRRDVLRCISELFILFILLLVLKIPFNFINDSLNRIFINFEKSYELLSSIWLFLSNTIYIILFIIVFLYVYKVRYLDKFEIKETIDEKDLEEHEEGEENIPKEKAKKSFVIFDFLGWLFNMALKIIVAIFAFWVIVLLLVLIIAFILSIIMIFNKIYYFGISIAFLGALLLTYVVMSLLVKFVFNAKQKFKPLFIVFLSGLLLSGIGSGVFAYEMTKTKYHDDIPKYIEKQNEEYKIEMNKDLIIDSNYYWFDDLKFIADNSLGNEVVIKTSSYSDYNKVSISNKNNRLYITVIDSYERVLNLFELVKENAKDKEFYNYAKLADCDIYVMASEENIEILKNNISKERKRQEEQEKEYNRYESEIGILEEELDKKNEKISDLEEKILELEERLGNIKNNFE